MKYSYVFLFMICVTFLVAQPQRKRDKIEALRTSYINQKVNFSDQEAQAFWPMYNEYNEKLENLKKKFRQQYVKNIDFNLMSEKDAESFLNAESVLKLKEYELHKEYYEKFRKSVPVKKIVLVRRAEDEFRKELIKNIKGSGEQR
jgi:Skp family chaperone for outer membrane proteins